MFRLLYDGPAAGPVDLVDTKLLLAIGIANASVNVVVVKKRALLRVPVHSLTTRSVDPAVRLKNSCTTAFCALLAGFVDEAAGGASGSADLNLVLGTLCGAVGVKGTALADREEEVVVVAVLSNERSLLSVFALGLERDVCGCSTGSCKRGVLHAHRKQVLPERAKRHDELGAIPVKSTIDSVVVLAG